jgi:hypothetical protein
MDDIAIHIHDRSVVGEVASAPFTADEADTHISEAIVHSAIIANVRTPVAVKEAVVSTLPTPIGRCPE